MSFEIPSCDYLRPRAPALSGLLSDIELMLVRDALPKQYAPAVFGFLFEINMFTLALVAGMLPALHEAARLRRVYLL